MICALVAAGVLALAFSGDRGETGESEPTASAGTPGLGRTDDAVRSVVEIGTEAGFPLQIRDFDPSTDRIELDLDRASFGDVGEGDLSVEPDLSSGAVRLVVAGEIVAEVHGVAMLDRAKVRVFAI